MKKTFSLIVALAFLLSSCQEIFTPAGLDVKCYTGEASEIDFSSAQLSGSASVKNAKENAQAFLYYVSADVLEKAGAAPTDPQNVKELGKEIQIGYVSKERDFTLEVQELSPGKAYYYTFLVRIGQEEFLGDVKSFRTKNNYLHHSLVMRFTADWCPHCANMVKSVERAMALYPDKMIQVAIYDELSHISSITSSKLQSLFYQYDSSSSVPLGLVDGRVQVTNYPEETAAGMFVDAVKTTEHLFVAETGIEVKSSLSGRHLSMDVDVHIRRTGRFRITVMLLQDGIDTLRIGEYGGNILYSYTHNSIACEVLSSAGGDSFYVTKAPDVQSFSYSAAIPETLNIDKMRILVYTQSSFDGKQKVQSGNYGDFYVDNCVTLAVGKDIPLFYEP